MNTSPLKLSAAISLSLCPLANAIEITWDTAGRQRIDAINDIETVNHQSDGSPIDTTFFFVCGNFTGTFEPDSSNLAQWADNFVPFGAARYSRIDVLAGSGFPAAFESQFARSRNLDTNNSPFEAGNSVYIWGFNVDPVTRTSSEWVLFTREEWTWPSFNASAGGDVGVYSVTDDINTVPPGTEIETPIGSIRIWVDGNNDGFHDNASSPLFTTAAVSAGLALPRISFDQWIAAIFPPVTGGATQDDAGPEDDRDSDGVSNFVEFQNGFDPLAEQLSGETLAAFSLEPITTSGGTFFEGTIARSPFADINWLIQESTTLLPTSWSDLTMSGTVITDAPNLLKVRAGVSVEADTENARFFRLQIAP